MDTEAVSRAWEQVAQRPGLATAMASDSTHSWDQAPKVWSCRFLEVSILNFEHGVCVLGASGEKMRGNKNPVRV